MYFHPHLYGNAAMHVVADCSIGIGIHGLLFLWCCLIDGLRFHTADLARKRAENQKRMLELRRTRTFVAEQNQNYRSFDNLTDFARSYYEEFGDIDGSGTIRMASLRLQHDPCGYNWADFILPKLLFFIIGTVSAIVTAIYRFPASIHENTETSFQNPKYHHWFVAASLSQIAVLGIWSILIINCVLTTGDVLRREPFLSTRPAQLAFRILVNIIILGVASIVVPFLFDFAILIGKWSTDAGSSSSELNMNRNITEETQLGQSVNTRRDTIVDVLIKVILHLTEKFPYSGTAAGLGPGELIYITSCTLVVAFIFLPSTTYFDFESDGRETKQERLKYDKRSVVTLARYSPTWRVFPLPIERQLHSASPIVKTHDSFQLEKTFRYHSDKVGRGLVYRGNYTPVFCVEIALWLLECCWQTCKTMLSFFGSPNAPHSRCLLRLLFHRIQNR